MSRDVSAEQAFLDQVQALVDRELKRRLTEIVMESPELVQDARRLIETPIAEWKEPVNSEIHAAVGGLKLEEAIIDELRKTIDHGTVPEAIEKRLTALQRSEQDLISSEPGGQYLRDGAYWRMEDTQSVLNRLFSNWARWLRGEPMEVP